MMKTKHTLVLVIAAVTAIWASCDADVPNGAKADDLYDGPIYISNTGEATITVIDGKTQKITRTIDLSTEIRGVPNQSHFISVTKNGRYLWVGERQNTEDGSTLVVDLHDEDKVVRIFNQGAHVGQHLSRDGKWLFAVVGGKGSVQEGNGLSFDYDNSILIYDANKLEYIGKISHGSAPHVLETTLDSKTLWTTNAGGGKVIGYDISQLPSVIPQGFREIDVLEQLKEAQFINALPFTAERVTLRALAVHPLGRHLIVGTYDDDLTTGGGDFIVDLKEEKVVYRIPGRPHNYDISPDRKYLLSGEANIPDGEEVRYLADHGHDVVGPIVRVIEIDGLSGATAQNRNSVDVDWGHIKIVKTVDAGALGTGAVNHQAYTPDGKYIVVAASAPSGSTTGNGRVLIVDVETLNLEEFTYDGQPIEEKPLSYKQLQVGKVPHGIAVPGYGR